MVRITSKTGIIVVAVLLLVWQLLAVSCSSGEIAQLSLSDELLNTEIIFQKGAFSPLYIMDADGSNERELTSEMGMHPCWLPDGTKITYCKYQQGGQNIDIYTADVDGSNETAIAEGLYPSWSPDGNRVAYCTYQLGGQSIDICIADADGSNEEKIAEGMYPYWSPDGSMIAFNNLLGTDICTVNVDGSNEATIAEGLYPSWSPDGSQIAFFKIDGGPLFGDMSSFSIYVMDADGSNQKRLAEGVGGTMAFGYGWGRVSWSPDSSKIVFAKMEETAPDVTGSFIYIMDADGRNQVKLTAGLNPVWSPFENGDDDESAWSEMEIGIEGDLWGIWGSSSSDVFAVGLTGSTLDHTGVILHYDGSTWSHTDIGSTTALLQDIWGSSATDVFAVGHNSWAPHGAIVHYDGSTWSPMVNNASNSILDVWGSSASDAFAVGEGSTILHYDSGD